MATTIMMLIVALFAVFSLPWFEQVRRYNIHHTDLMAGDE